MATGVSRQSNTASCEAGRIPGGKGLASAKVRRLRGRGLLAGMRASEKLGTWLSSWAHLALRPEAPHHELAANKNPIPTCVGVGGRVGSGGLPY